MGSYVDSESLLAYKLPMLTAHRRFEIFLCLFAALTSLALVSLLQPRAAVAQPNNAAMIDNTLRVAFGSPLETVKAFKPYYLLGDFNGDGAEDVLVIVMITGQRSELAKDVNISNPFESAHKVAFPTDPATANRLAIAIVHSWKAPQATGKFLLIGDSNLLILDHERATSGRTEDQKDLMSVMKHRGPRPKGPKFPVAAKGDVALLGNQVGDDSMLYWNGRTYRWVDSQDGN